MKSTKQKPTAPGWYWYRDEVTGVVAAEVFHGSEYHGGKLIAFVPGYNYLPDVDTLDGDWSDTPIESIPPWMNDLVTPLGTDARGKT